MAADSLGTARLTLTVDTSDYEAAIARSKNSAAGLGEAAETAYTKSSAGAKRAADSLLKYVNNLDKSVEQQKLLNAAQRGVPLDVLTAAEGKLNALAAATDSAARAAQRLRDTQAFEKQAAEAAKLNKASEYVRFWTQELEKVEAVEARLGAQNAFLSQLQAQVTAIGKTRAELVEMRAAELGVAQAAAPLVAQLKAQENALYGTTTKLDKYGLSAKQTAQALRQVPAQITDIFVSLQGGQAPLTVLLQQGGQLKDVFGGVVPAVRALGAALGSLLINPVVLAAAAVAGLGYAFFKSEENIDAFNQALVFSGDQSGRTAADLGALTREIAESSSSSQGAITEAITAVIAGGKIAVDQQEKVADASAAMARITGKSVSDVVAEFNELGRDPVTAILKLNESQNFLTETTLRQIRAFVEQGETAKASALAIDTYANTVISRTAEVELRLGYLSRAWLGVKDVAKDAWAAMLNVGAEKSVPEKLKALDEELKTTQSRLQKTLNSDIGGALRENLIKGFTTDLRRIEGEYKDVAGKIRSANKSAEGAGPRIVDSAKEKSRQEAEKAFAAIVEGNLTKQAKLEAEITKIRELGIKSGLASTAEGRIKIEEQVAAARRKAAESASKGSSIGNATSRADLQGFKDSLTEERAAIAASTKELKAQYDAKLISANDYYTKLKGLVQQDTAAQEQALQSQIASLNGRNVSGKDAISVGQQLSTLEAQLAKVRSEGATALIVLGIQEQDVARKRAAAIQAYKETLDRSNAALEAQVTAQVAAIGMGEKEARQQEELNRIRAEGIEKIRQLNLEKSKNPADAAMFDEEIQAEQEYTDRRVEIARDGFARIDAAQQDWLAGVRGGIKDWTDEQSKVADQVRGLTTSILDKSASAFAEFAETGKLNIKSLLSDILKQVLQFLAKQAILSFVKLFAGSVLGNTSGDLVSTGDFMANAKGGVYSSPSLSAHRNTVVSQPTPFLFAKGAGIMGEAGPEAIMPLTRGADGNLGVRMAGGAGGPVSINVQTIVNSDGSAESKTTSSGDNAALFESFTNQMRSVAEETVNRAMMPGGSLWKAGVAAQ